MSARFNPDERATGIATVILGIVVLVVRRVSIPTSGRQGLRRSGMNESQIVQYTGYWSFNPDERATGIATLVPVFALQP